MLQTTFRLLFAAALVFVGIKVLDGSLAVRHVFILLAVPVLLWALSRMQRREAAYIEHDWRCLRPSTMHWVGLALSVGLTGLMLYVYLFVGSSRADAASQMTILLGLIMAFGTSAVVMGVLCFQAVVRWNDDRIESWLGPWPRGVISWRELAQAEHDGPGSPIVLEAVNGKRLKIDATLDGAEELLQRIAPWIVRPEHS